MTGAREYSLFIAQSYDRQFGEKYDHNLARYNCVASIARKRISLCRMVSFTRNNFKVKRVLSVSGCFALIGTVAPGAGEPSGCIWAIACELMPKNTTQVNA